MSVNEIKMASKSQEHETPDLFFSKLHTEFHFELDACASETNHKVKKFYTKKDNVFSKQIVETTWVNPEFKYVGKFVKFFYHQSLRHKSTVVMLIMVKSNTNWWRDYVMKAKEVRFINQKLAFKGSDQGLRFPLAIIVFGPHDGETKFSVMNN